MKVKTTGIKETVKTLEALNRNTDAIIEGTVVAGANIVADSMRSEIKTLKVSNVSKDTAKNGKRYARPKDIKGLLDSMGFSPVREKGSAFNSNVGFRGYNNDKTEKYPNGHANKMIANAINKGTSFMVAQPFVSRTKKKSQDKCVSAMQKKLDEEINKITK